MVSYTGWGHKSAGQTMNKSCAAITAKQETACDRCLACVRANTAIQLLQEEMGSPLPQGAGVSGVDVWCPQGAGAEAAGPLLAMRHMTSVLAPLALGKLPSISCPETVMLAKGAAHQNDMLAASYIKGGLNKAAYCCAAQTAIKHTGTIKLHIKCGCCCAISVLQVASNIGDFASVTSTI